jgi:hypothetical protein
MLPSQAGISTLAWQQFPVRNGYLTSDERIVDFMDAACSDIEALRAAGG